MDTGCRNEDLEGSALGAVRAQLQHLTRFTVSEEQVARRAQGDVVEQVPATGAPDEPGHLPARGELELVEGGAAPQGLVEALHAR